VKSEVHGDDEARAITTLELASFPDGRGRD
jgi:hypothetical protein